MAKQLIQCQSVFQKVLDGDYKKSVRVARTEVHRVREAGLNEGARDFDAQLKEAGVDMRMAKIWRTMKDNRVRPNVVRKKKRYYNKNGSRRESYSNGRSGCSCR